MPVNQSQHLLLVEDNPVDREAVHRALGTGIPIVSAESLADAIRTLENGTPECVLLDLHLPDAQGLDALEKLLNSTGRSVPIVVLSGMEDEEVALRSLERGAEDYLVKGRDDALLPRAVRYALKRFQVARELRKSEARLAIALEASEAGVFEHSVPPDRDTYHNGKWASILGFAIHDLPPYDQFMDWLMDRVHPSDAKYRNSAFSEFVEGRTPFYEVEVRLRHRDGHWVHVYLRAQAVERDGEGRARRVTGVMVDISEQKRQEVRLMQSERMASVGTMAAGVAHEINNPLAVVMAHLDFLTNELKTPETSAPSAWLRELGEAVSEAQDAAERIRRIVRGLRTFSHTGEERPVILELHRPIEIAINMSFNEIRHRARLVKDYGRPPQVFIDESRLVQVLVNLLVNAAQAMTEGGDGEIRIVTGEDFRGEAVIEIKDNGPGIPEDVQKCMFDPFFTTKPVGQGTGLGLAISRNLVQAMGGSLDFESSEVRGTTFRIRLPPLDVDKLDLSPGRSGSGSEALSRPTVARGQVLVIDDERLIGAALKRGLRDEHDVTVLTKGEEAIERVQAGERFDVILCDLMMPGMSGMEFFRALDTTAPELAQRVIFTTGGAFSRDAAEFLEQVPNQRIEKPFDWQQLKAAVRALLLQSGS